MSIPLGKTTFAMCSGVATVCSVGLAAQSMDEDPCPPFSASAHGTPRFDLSTFAGRFKANLFAMSPLLLANSEATLRGYQGEIKAALSEGGELSEEANRELWRKKLCVDAAIHPDTNESVPHPFRMSGYVPFNGPISVAMVASGSTGALL
jgi:hypothetical protein